MWDDDDNARLLREAREVQWAHDLQRQHDSRFASQSEGSGASGCFLVGLLCLLVVFVGVVVL